MPYAKLLKKRNNNKGFTVIELMVVIAIVAILGLIGIGPTIRWRANSFVESAANNLMSDFERAKIEAVRNGRRVNITFQDSGTYTCYIDVNENGVYDTDGTERLIYNRTPEIGRVNMQINSAAPPFTAVFDPRGFLRNVNQIVIDLSGTNSKANLVRQITVNRIGNVSSTATRN